VAAFFTLSAQDLSFSRMMLLFNECYTRAYLFFNHQPDEPEWGGDVPPTHLTEVYNRLRKANIRNAEPIRQTASASDLRTPPIWPHHRTADKSSHMHWSCILSRAIKSCIQDSIFFAERTPSGNGAWLKEGTATICDKLEIRLFRQSWPRIVARKGPIAISAPRVS